MKFELDLDKEKRNIKNHSVSFTATIHVFTDANSIEMYDEKHSIFEERFKMIGKPRFDLEVLFVVYTMRHDSIRIVTARKASAKERNKYYDHQKKNLI